MTDRPKPLLICDDANGKHVWADEFSDGDTCACGRFYLNLHPAQVAFSAELIEAADAGGRRYPSEAKP